jgi:CubicO group peptidase (beta-lactamase class C family)
MPYKSKPQPEVDRPDSSSLTRRGALGLGTAAVLGWSPLARAFVTEASAAAGRVIRNQADNAFDLGFSADGLDTLARVFGEMLDEGLHPGAQLAIFRNGEFVIELAGGTDGAAGEPVTENTLFQMRSTTKALAVLVMLILHDRGRFSFDDPVAKHWPEFGANGKDKITIGQVVSHRAGIPDGPMIPVEKMGDRDAVAAAVAAMKPIWEPGTANGYHAATIGWICDELVYRWEKKPLHVVLEEEILTPLGVTDLYLGLPREEYPRMAHMVVEDRVREGQVTRARFSDFINTYEGVSLPLSWVMGVATARALAHVMSIPAHEGTLGGRAFYSAATQKLVTTPTNDPGVVDLRLQAETRWGLGFILGDTPNMYGSVARPRVIGHAGGSATVAWADPDLRLSVAFLCNRMMSGSKTRYRRIGDAVYGALA